MGQGVLAGVERLAGQQRLGKRARTRQRMGLLAAELCAVAAMQLVARTVSRQWLGGQAFHGALIGCQPTGKSATASTWSSATKRGGMAHAGKLDQPRLGAALRHGPRGFARQQVGLGAAYQQGAGP